MKKEYEEKLWQLGGSRDRILSAAEQKAASILEKAEESSKELLRNLEEASKSAVHRQIHDKKESPRLSGRGSNSAMKTVCSELQKGRVCLSPPGTRCRSPERRLSEFSKR